MRWWQRRHQADRAEAERDLNEAKATRARAERATERVRSRWDRVHEITQDSRRLRGENHLAQSIIILFRSHS